MKDYSNIEEKEYFEAERLIKMKEIEGIH